MFNDFMTLDVLTTFAGLTATTMLIVQFTKFLIKKRFGDSYVRLYSFIIALILTFVFAIIVNIAMYYKLDKISMTESLKSIE